jgi:hypothetical protein
MPNDSAKSLLDEWLGRVAPLTALASLASLLIAIVHEYAYFSVIGDHFLSALTTTDFIRSAILWLLPTLLTVLLLNLVGIIVAGISWQAAFRKYDSVSTKDFASIARRDLDRAKAMLSDHRRALGRGRLVIILVGVLFFGLAVKSALDGYLVGGVLLALVYFSMLATMFSAPDWRDRYGKIVMIACTVIGTLAGLFSMSQLTAWSDLHSYTPAYRIDLKENEEQRQVVMLRTIEKGLVFRDPGRNRVELVRWEDIKGISRITPSKWAGWPWTCRRLGLWCDEAPIVP